MTDTASQTAPETNVEAETNPIQELRERFDMFSKMYQTLLGCLNTFPIDATNKVVIFHDFVSGYTHTLNYVNAVIAQMAQPKVVDDDSGSPEAPGPL
jgi:hypothetical protein